MDWLVLRGNILPLAAGFEHRAGSENSICNLWGVCADAEGGVNNHTCYTNERNSSRSSRKFNTPSTRHQ